MTRYFPLAKVADTFYGQRIDSYPQEPMNEFEIIGVDTDLVTAVRFPPVPGPRTLHVFNRHTGMSSDGWVHVAWFERRYFNRAVQGLINLWKNKVAVAWIWFLTLLAVSVLIATWPIGR